MTVTLLGGKIEVSNAELNLPCYELTKLDEYRLTWTCGGLLVTNKTDMRITMLAAKYRRDDPALEPVTATAKTVDVPPAGTALVLFYREPSQEYAYILQVVQAIRESRSYALEWAVISAVASGLAVAMIMSAYQKSKERMASTFQQGGQ